MSLLFFPSQCFHSALLAFCLCCPNPSAFLEITSKKQCYVKIKLMVKGWNVATVGEGGKNTSSSSLKVESPCILYHFLIVYSIVVDTGSCRWQPSLCWGHSRPSFLERLWLTASLAPERESPIRLKITSISDCSSMLSRVSRGLWRSLEAYSIL